MQSLFVQDGSTPPTVAPVIMAAAQTMTHAAAGAGVVPFDAPALNAVRDGVSHIKGKNINFTTDHEHFMHYKSRQAASSDQIAVAQAALQQPQ